MAEPDASAILRFLLTAPADARELHTLEDWWRAHQTHADRFELPVDHALAAGFSADRLGYAFGSGYQCAGVAMFAAGDGSRLGAFCATESGGVHPRAIETSLVAEPAGFRLRGHKSFVTFGPAAEVLWVVAHQGTGDDGRKRLCVVAVEPADGVAIEPLPPLGFVPEIPHASVALDVHVDSDQLLTGDGYNDYLKPFRTVEDCHVHAALLGWLIAVGRRAAWSQQQLSQLCALVVTVRGMTLSDPRSPAVHIALAGALAQARRVMAGLDWARVDDATRERFERDRPLLSVAGKARDARLQAAWRRVTRP